MDIDHLPPQQLSSDSTLSGWTLYPEQVFDYAGGSYVAPHHVNNEHHQLQHQNAYYVSAQTEAPQYPDLPPASPMPGWPSAQSYYGNHELHYPATPVDQFQSIPSATYAESYGTTGYSDVSPSAAMTAPSAVTAIPTFGPLPTIAPHQSESGHDLMPRDATAHPALCEGAATFETTNTNYGLYENAYATTTGESHPQYTRILAQDQPQPYVATYIPVAQGQYVAPVSASVPEAPVPAASPASPARLKRKASSESLNIRSRGRSPMGHLPYQEDIAKAGTKSRRSSIFSGLSSSSSSTPRPPSPIPVLQPLTFITYPDLEPKGHGRGGDCDGNGDDDDDDDDGSPRRGRRGKKQPKKEPFLACFFCRGRKIACHPKNDGGEDKTCTSTWVGKRGSMRWICVGGVKRASAMEKPPRGSSAFMLSPAHGTGISVVQCAKRRLECKYPHTSRRGQRKPQDPAAAAATITAITACKPRAARASSKRSASSYGRI
ncbi:hypothetical protein BJY52DRAFT_1224704 [Lactarius psammicola]|nr:hypothetical protein BJY52DRAFT_1224704 [Lactarius psammicola]